jgi:hypothetical protein
MGGEKNFLMLSHGSDFKVVLDGAEPIIRVEGSGALGQHRWIGVLEIPKASPWGFLAMSFSFFIAAVSRSSLSNLSKCGNVGFAFCVCALAILH